MDRKTVNCFLLFYFTTLVFIFCFLGSCAVSGYVNGVCCWKKYQRGKQAGKPGQPRCTLEIINCVEVLSSESHTSFFTPERFVLIKDGKDKNKSRGYTWMKVDICQMVVGMSSVLLSVRDFMG